MKALVLESPRKLVLKTVDTPSPGPDDILVKVAAVGVCRSDHHQWEIGIFSPAARGILGHEIAGTIAAVGRNIRNYQVGDRVVVPFSGSDGICPYCNSGKPHLCDAPMHPSGSYPGGFAEYVNVPGGDRNVVALPEEVSFLEGAALGCRFITAFHGIVDRARLQEGESVAVFGCGGVGLSAINIAEAGGATVIAVDVNAENLALAGSLGAHHLINANKEDAVKRIVELTGGVDLAIDALGSVATCTNALDSLRKGGRLLQIGITMDNCGKIPLPITQIVMRELEVIGALGMPAFRYNSLWPLIRRGRLTPGKLVTGEIALSDVDQTFQDMSNNVLKGARIVTRFE